MNERVRVTLAVWSLTFLLAATAGGDETPEQRTSRYFDSICSQPSLLLAFLREMPKGGDLHNHLSGAVYAESYIGFAARDGLCVDRNTSALLPPPCDAAKNQVSATAALGDPVLYGQMIDAFSMRNFRPAQQSGHDHFFDAFRKFGPATQGHTGEMLAEVVSRAAAEHEVYLELMTRPERGEAARLGGRLGWDDDLGRLREKLLGNGLTDVVASGKQALDQAEAKMRELLRCAHPESTLGGSGLEALHKPTQAGQSTPPAGPDAGCGVVVRYLYDVGRALPREQVFAQILAGFELARADARMVGLNLVMPEDAYIPIHDFDLHMRMLDYLRRIYPQAHISLHAGELAPQLVRPEDLRFHIRESIDRGHAERIGHGVDVMHERDPLALLRDMRRRNVLVEICLTSNVMILGVQGMEHPLPIYLRYGVPVALATDDEGVERSDMTREYKRAVETYHLGYGELKKMARDSIQHSFLSGPSVWAETGSGRRSRPGGHPPRRESAAPEFRPVAACAGIVPRASSGSRACGRFLAGSERARVQWKLEVEFNQFEKQVTVHR